MNRSNLIFAILISFLLLHGQLNAQKHTNVSMSIPETVEVIKDIQYVNYQDRELLLDIYKPANWEDGKLPTLLVIRGGSWLRGDKEGFRHVAAALALRGFATVCVEYRTSREATFPAAVLDIKSAVKWIKDNADRYNFDANSIGAIGGSAGAHLAALIGVSANVDSLNPTEKTEDFRIHAVVGLATPPDLIRDSVAKIVIKWIGKPYKSNEELWESASPLSHIDVDSPPMLFIHSSSDKVVPFEQALLAIEKLGKVGVYSELVLIPNAPHPFWKYEEWFNPTMDKAAAFFHEQLKK